MLQWFECKESAKDAILLFRLGDFYEAFNEDAEVCAKELDLTLTKRQQTPMSGLPAHAAEPYIDKLLARGYKVAIAEQVEDPKKTKGLVKREVIRILTPGTLVSSSLLEDKENNYIASLNQVGMTYGLAFLDLSTSEFLAIELDGIEEVETELSRFRPKELITSEKIYNKHPAFFAEIKRQLECRIDVQEEWRFEHRLNYGTLTKTFGVHSLDGFGMKGMVPAINSAGALVSYVQESLKCKLGPIEAIRPYSNKSCLSLDKTTLKNLELVETPSKSKKFTLFSTLDYTLTPMGGRELKRWILQPLIDCEKITHRQNAVQELLNFEGLKEPLSSVRDLERLMTKIATFQASPKDFVALKTSLEPIGELHCLLLSAQSPLLQEIASMLNPLSEVVEAISATLVDEPPYKLSDGGAIRTGINGELDELRSLARDSKEWMEQYQLQIRNETGIKTLKVGFTSVSGFYIEVSKGQASNVPANFLRKQTLVNAERFITPALKLQEDKLLTAEENALEIERTLFNSLQKTIIAFSHKVMGNAKAIAHLDCLYSFAEAAKENRYCRPIVDNSNALQIISGRHPVIEKALLQEPFTCNDTTLDGDKEKMMLITGPNMSGKSTYIRQTALIAIMAHMGSFVPADRAHIGLIDKVFTRIGASDDLSRGQSTFMVEMTETANILHHATARSLVILDEIGRGTSTYDGISLAWSIAEYLLTAPDKGAKTLFATHYFELTKLEERVPGAVNYNVAVLEKGEELHFLRKIVRGGADKSYGIHVGRIAGLPSEVLLRAEEILLHLEENANQKNTFAPSKPKRATLKPRPEAKDFQLSLGIELT